MHIRQRGLAVPSILFAALALTATFGSGACGSSDSAGEKDPGDAGPDGLVIPQPLSIVARSPLPDDDNVSVRSPIQITYDQEVRVTPTSVTLSGPNSAVIATTASVSEDEKTVTVKPVSEMPTGVKLTLTINDIRKAKDDSPAQSNSWSWTVPTWLRVQGAGAIPGEASFLGSPIVIAGPGDRVITTVDNKGLALVQLNGSHNAWSQLGDPLDVSTIPRPSLAFDKDGALVMAYLTPKGSNQPWDVRVRRWSGTAWESLGQVLGDAADSCPYFCHPTIVRARNTGQLFVAYTRQGPGDPGPAEILVVKTFAGGQWTQVGGDVSEPSTGAQHLGLAVSDAGIPFVVYSGGNGARGTWVRTLSQDQKWVLVGDTPNLPNDFPDNNLGLALDGRGAPALFGCFGGKYQLRRLDGVRWVSGGENSFSGCGGAGYHAFLSSDPSGRLFAFWSTASLQAADVTNSIWRPVDPLSASANVRANSLTIDPNGTPVVGWSEDNKSIKIQRLNR